MNLCPKLEQNFCFMKKITRIIALFAFLCTLGLQAWSQTEAEMQKIYMSYLKKQGYKPEVDDDGDVTFESDDRSYFIGVDEDDPEFFRLVLPNIWPIESELERLRVYEAVDQVNQSVKVAKIHTVGDNVWISVEAFQSDIEDFDAFFERYLNLIELCIEEFQEAME